MRKSNNYTVLKLKNVANTRQGEGRSGLTAQYSFAEPYAYHAAVAGEFCLIRGKTSFTSDDYGNGGVLGFTAECLGEGGGSLSLVAEEGDVRLCGFFHGFLVGK